MYRYSSNLVILILWNQHKRMTKMTSVADFHMMHTVLNWWVSELGPVGGHTSWKRDPTHSDSRSLGQLCAPANQSILPRPEQLEHAEALQVGTLSIKETLLLTVWGCEGPRGLLGAWNDHPGQLGTAWLKRGLGSETFLSQAYEDETL